MRWSRCGFVACLVALAVSVDAQGVSAVREYQPGVDARHYSFTVVIPDSGRRVEVHAALTLRRTRAVDSLRLDLESPMQVARVVVNGRDTRFARDEHTLRVPLPARRTLCATVDSREDCDDVVLVDVAGSPTDGLIISKDPSNRWQYFADHWPNRARNWLPAIDHPSDKATIEWRVHAPSSLRVIANGRLAEESPLPNQPGRTITVWRSEIPLPVYLMTIGVAPMARIDLGPTACGFARDGGCVQQDVYEAPELAPRSPPGFAAANRIVTWLSRWVAPFPYEKLSHVESSTRFGGMENASAIFYADGQFRNMTLGEGLVAHETAHQWFGDAVTPARWADLWLSEGFATYFATLFEGEARGDTAFRRSLASVRQRALAANEVKTRPVIDTTQTVLMSLLNRNSYEKGGFVLHMLRREVGDSAWIRGIRAYYAEHKHANAMTDDLRRAVERTSGANLKWFFDQWLTRPGYPQLTVSWEYDETLTARIVQDTTYGAFRLRIPVEIVDASGAVRRTVLEVPASFNAQLTFSERFTQRPQRVTFDPDGDVLGVITAK